MQRHQVQNFGENNFIIPFPTIFFKFSVINYKAILNKILLFHKFKKQPKASPTPSCSQGILKHYLGCILKQKYQKNQVCTEMVSLVAVLSYNDKTPRCWPTLPALQFPYSHVSLPYNAIWLEHIPGRVTYF